MKSASVLSTLLCLALAARAYGVSSSDELDGTDSATTVEVSNVTELIAAVAAATDGTEIHLAPGTYDLPATVLSVTVGARIYGDDWRTTVIRQVNTTKTNCRVMTIDHADARVENVTITGGRSVSNWDVDGGIKIGYSGGTVSDCMISNNVLNASNGFGAGVGMQGGTLRHSYVIKNTATSGYGGGVGFYSGSKSTTTPIVDSCLIADNSAINGGGITFYWGNSSAYWGVITIRNCTIAHNSATTGGGIYSAGYPQLKVENCIVAGNSVTTTTGNYSPNIVANNYESNVIAGFSNCLIGSDGDQKAIEGNGNIKGTPVFKSVEGGDYHLMATSDARSLGVWYEGILTDLDGLERPSPNFDAGCYQYVADKSFAVFAAMDRETAFVDEEVRFMATPDNPPEGATLTYEWTLKSDRDGVADITFSGQDVTRTVAAGSWTPSVTCTSDSPAASVTGAVGKTLKIGVRKIFVTSRANEHAAFPYDTENAAATNLIDVLGGLIGGETIDLDEGVHVTSAEPLIDKGVTLVGRGVGRTILKSGAFYEKQYTRVLRLNHASSVVSNLTLQGQATIGHYRHGSVLCIDTGGGTAARCRITGGSFAAGNGYGAGVAILSDSGRLVDCEIDSCTNAYSWAAALYCEGKGLVRGCLIRDCYSASTEVIRIADAATIESCTIVRNRTDGTDAKSVVAYMYSVPNLIVNTIFADNTAPNNACEDSASLGKPNWSFMIAAYVKNTPTNCWFGSKACGTGSIAVDPKFINAAAGDFRPARSSPCIKAGQRFDWMTTATDLKGCPRLTRDQVDMGCYQRRDPAGLCVFFR